MNPEYAAFAREQLAETDAGHKVEIRVGIALEMLPALEQEAHRGEPYDAVFLDADKEHYPEFLIWATTVLRPNGLLMADNVLHSSSWNETLLDPATHDARILAVREFNRRLAAHPRFTSIIVPMREGVAVAVFHP
jgi:predicted O-methyltransferase YrrM